MGSHDGLRQQPGGRRRHVHALATQPAAEPLDGAVVTEQPADLAGHGEVDELLVVGIPAGNRRLRHRVDYRILALVALQLYLTVFYLFIQIPYASLNSLTLFVAAFLVLVVGGTPLFRPAGRVPAAP